MVNQDWESYTPCDHAVWRHVLRGLVDHLRDRAHESYARGLDATGIGTVRIPRLDEMYEKLSCFGWSAAAVRGFIPPAVFTGRLLHAELDEMAVLTARVARR